MSRFPSQLGSAPSWYGRPGQGGAMPQHMLPGPGGFPDPVPVDGKPWPPVPGPWRPKPAPIGGFGSPGNAPAWRPTPPPGMSEGKYPFSDFKNIWGGQEEEEEEPTRGRRELPDWYVGGGRRELPEWLVGGGQGGGGGWSPRPLPVEEYITRNQSMRGGPLGGMATMRSQASPGGMPQQMGAPMGFGGVPGGGGGPSMMTSRASSGSTRGQGGGGDLGDLLGSFGGGAGSSGFDLDKLFDTIGDIRKKNRPPAPYGGHLTQGPYWETAPNWYRGSGGNVVGPGWGHGGKGPEAAVHQNQYQQWLMDNAWNREKYGMGVASNPNARGVPGAIAPDWYVHSPDTQVGQVSAGWWHNPFGTGSPDAAAKTNQLLQEQRMRDWQGRNRQDPSIAQIEHARPWTTRHIPYPDQGPMNFGLGGGGPDLKGLIGGIFGKEGGGGGGRPDELFGFTGGGIPNPLGTVADQGYFGSSFGSGGLPETNIKSGPAPQWAINQSGKNILRTPGIADDPTASAAMAASGAQAANQFTRDFSQQNAQFGLTRDTAVANQGLALAKYMLERKGADQAITTGERQAILGLIQQLGLLG